MAVTFEVPQLALSFFNGSGTSDLLNDSSGDFSSGFLDDFLDDFLDLSNVFNLDDSPGNFSDVLNDVLDVLDFNDFIMPELASGDKPAKPSNEIKLGASDDISAQASGESPTQASGDSPIKASGDSLTKASGDSPTQASGNESTEASGDNSTQESDDKPMQASGIEAEAPDNEPKLAGISDNGSMPAAPDNKTAEPGNENSAFPGSSFSNPIVIQDDDTVALLGSSSNPIVIDESTINGTGSRKRRLILHGEEDGRKRVMRKSRCKNPLYDCNQWAKKIFKDI